MIGSGQGIHGLNNAGIGVGGPVEFVALNEWRRQLEVNVIGQGAVTQAFLPDLRTGKGRIVNIGSIGGLLANPFLAPYCASKAGMEAITDSLRVELRKWGMWVAIIEPGAIATPIWEKAKSHTCGPRSRKPRGEARRAPGMAPRVGNPPDHSRSDAR